MSNSVSFYFRNVLEDSGVTATEVATGSSALYAYDNMLSFAFGTTAGVTETTLQVDQPGSNIRDFRYLVLMNHSGIAGGIAAVSTFSTDARETGTVLVSGTIPNDDPAVIDLGSVQSGKQYIDVKLIASGTNSVRVGEVGLMSKFDSPRGPEIRVQSSTQPRRTYIDLPTGERRSIQHAQPGRVKNYRITGLTQAQAQLWKDRFDANEGIRLLVLTDDEDETYVVLWNTAFRRDRELNIFSVDLEFVEVRL